MASNLEKIAPFIALLSAIILGVVLFFVLTTILEFDQTLGASIAIGLAGIDYFIMRFVFAKIIKQQNSDQ